MFYSEKLNRKRFINDYCSKYTKGELNIIPKKRQIKKILARQIIDSRGNPTVEVDVYTGNALGRASVASGSSTGLYECVELRDNTKQYNGRGVSTAINNVNKVIAPKLIGRDVESQEEIDNTMVTIDGTENKSRLGANAILGVSMAVAKCAAKLSGKQLYSYLGSGSKLPVPLSNFINGGRHSGSQLHIQEFLAIPSKAKSFSYAVMQLAETYHILKDILQKKYGRSATNVGDEGGFVPPVSRVSEALELLTRAIEEAGYSKEIFLGLDAAASEFYNWKLQRYNIENKKLLDRAEMINYYNELIKTYPIVSIEDPFDQDDFESFKQFMRTTKIQVVGDDLLATSIKRIKNAMEDGLCNAAIIKPNQVGTLTETINATKLVMKNKWNAIISHRSGETEDSFIVDLAVALNCGQIKIGAPCRGERTIKFNKLLRIEEELKQRAKYLEPNFIN